jgi:hypothetical protein
MKTVDPTHPRSFSQLARSIYPELAKEEDAKKQAQPPLVDQWNELVQAWGRRDQPKKGK